MYVVWRTRTEYEQGKGRRERRAAKIKRIIKVTKQKGLL
jgi:hypothetical protein